MMSLPFDTQKMVDRLEHVGVTGEQARAHVEVLVEAMAARDTDFNDRYANRRELEDIRAAVVHVEAKLTDVRAELIRWVVSVGLLQTALVSALLIKLVH